MRKLIENLRQRPESHRHVVAFTVSLAITLIIAGIWATTVFPSNLSSSQKAAQAENARYAQAQGPVKTFSRNVAQSFGALKGQWSSIGSYFTETKYEAEPTLEVVNPMENFDDSVVNY